MSTERSDECASEPWKPSSGVISERNPAKVITTRNPLWRYISKNVPLPFVIAEFFFAAWMSCVAVNLIGGFADLEHPKIVSYALTAAYSINIIWGIINGWAYNITAAIAFTEDDRMLYRLKYDWHDAEAKAYLIESLNNGPARHLSCREKEEVLLDIVTSDIDVHPKKVHKLKKERHHVVISFVIINLIVATFTMLPFIVLSGNLGAALLISRFVTVATFAIVAYVTARYLNRNWLFWVAVMSALGVLVAQMTFIYS